MRTRFTAHVLSALILGSALSLFGWWYDARMFAQGKQAYLAEKSALFDRRVTDQGTRVVSCVVGVTLVGGGFAVYELLAMAIFAVIKPRSGQGAA